MFYNFTYFYTVVDVLQAMEYATLTGDGTELTVRGEYFSAFEDDRVRDDITGETNNKVTDAQAAPLSVSLLRSIIILTWTAIWNIKAKHTLSNNTETYQLFISVLNT